MTKAIRSFPKSSAGGLDGLRPQHLKGHNIGEEQSGHPSSSHHIFCTVGSRRKNPSNCPAFLFRGQSNCPQQGIRGDKSDCRELHAAPPSGKSCRKQDYKGALEELALRQLGFGVKGGAEAAVHAVRFYLQDPDPDKAVLKLDIRKAFNTIHRDWMLNAIREHAPTLHPIVHSAYSSPSSLFRMDRTI